MDSKKKYYRSGKEIKTLVYGFGGCIASDEITVKGRKVGYAYREEPNVEEDSGWCFLAGDESQEYLDDPDNMGFFNVNTIANYDPDIISILEEPIGSHYLRDENIGNFKKLERDT